MVLPDGPQAPQELVELRAKLRTLADPIPSASGTTISVPGTTGRRVFEVRPASASSGSILYVHGGAFCLLGVEPYLKMAGHLAKITGCPIHLPEYRLPPEWPYPHPLIDVVDAYSRWYASAPEGPRVVAGDSAGANLALAMLQVARELGLAHPDLVVLFSPWLDLRLGAASVTTNDACDTELDAAALSDYARAYAGAMDLGHPLLSPRLIDGLGWPPLLIQAGEREILLDDARALASAATLVGVDAKLQVAPDMQHNYQFWGPLMPEAIEAYRAVAAEVERARSAR